LELLPVNPMKVAATTHLIAIETSSDVCSVAAFSDQRLLRELRTDRPRSHATHLVPMIEQLLLESLEGRIDAVAISSGPGSYTGLRIGVSAAKGLAFSREVGIVAIPTLETIARGFLAKENLAPSSGEQPIIVVSPSRRDEVYCAAFKGSSTQYPERLFEETPIEISSFNDLVLKNGIKKAHVLLSAPIPAFEAFTKNIPLYTVHIAKPSAVDVGYCALKKVARGEYEDTSTFEPYYLKAFHAKKPRLSALDRLSF